MLHKTFSLITLNTWKNDGELEHRLPLMLEGLKKCQADIICLQEVFSEIDGRNNTAEYLAERLGYNCAFAPARKKQRLTDGKLVSTYSGMALLTREPVLSHRIIQLPTIPEDGERIAQWVEVESLGRRLNIVNVHLTYLPDASMLRQAQIELILNTVKQESNEPVFIAGDFNEPHNGPLFRRLEDATTGCHYRRVPEPELWAQLPSAAKSGLDRAGPLDHAVLIAPERKLDLVRCRYLFEHPDTRSQRYASDHVGVESEWSLPKVDGA